MIIELALLYASAQYYEAAQTLYTQEKVKAVYAKVEQASGIYLPLKFSSAGPICGGNSSNAYNNGTSVTVCRGLITRGGDIPALNENELALILGHELGHSNPKVRKLGLMKNELGADKVGASYAKKSGYDICTGAKWLLRTGAGGYDYFRGKPVSYHPGGQERYHALGCS